MISLEKNIYTNKYIEVMNILKTQFVSFILLTSTLVACDNKEVDEKILKKDTKEIFENPMDEINKIEVTNLYDTEIITITGQDGIQFDGLLKINPKDKTDKLVIFVNGLGPNTYENKRPLTENKVFIYHEVLGNQIVDDNTAYFSYNTRGVTLGFKPPLYANIDEQIYKTYLPNNAIKDVEQIVNTLKADERLKDAKVYLLGWNEGSTIATHVAYRNNVLLDGLLLAGYMNEGMKEILEWQLSGGSSMVNYGIWFDENKDGKITEEEFSKDKYKMVKNLGILFSDIDINKDKVINEEDFEILLEPYKLDVYTAIEQDNDKWLKENYSLQLTARWFNEYFKLEPNKNILPKLNLPVYIFQGTNDATTPVAGARNMQEIIKINNKKNITIDIFEGEDHNLNFDQFLLYGIFSKGLQAIFNTIKSF